MKTLQSLVDEGKLTNEKHKAQQAMLYVNSLIIRQQAKIFEKYKLNQAKYDALILLRAQYPAPASEKQIRAQATDKKIDFPRMILGLEKDGLVKRVRNKHDKRVIDVIITARGLKTLTRLDKMKKEIFLSTSILSDREARQLISYLKKMTAVLAS